MRACLTSWELVETMNQTTGDSCKFNIAGFAGGVNPIFKRKDPAFKELVSLAASKGLNLRKNVFGMGFLITYSDKTNKSFKSFIKLKEWVETFIPIQSLSTTEVST